MWRQPGLGKGHGGDTSSWLCSGNGQLARPADHRSHKSQHRHGLCEQDSSLTGNAAAGKVTTMHEPPRTVASAVPPAYRGPCAGPRQGHRCDFHALPHTPFCGEWAFRDPSLSWSCPSVLVPSHGHIFPVPAWYQPSLGAEGRETSGLSVHEASRPLEESCLLHILKWCAPVWSKQC